MDAAGALGAGDQGRGYGDVGDIAWCDDQCEGTTDHVGESVDLRGLVAARGQMPCAFAPFSA